MSPKTEIFYDNVKYYTKYIQKFNNIKYIHT